jgi:hypothetical protein
MGRGIEKRREKSPTLILLPNKGALVHEPMDAWMAER